MNREYHQVSLTFCFTTSWVTFVLCRSKKEEVGRREMYIQCNNSHTIHVKTIGFDIIIQWNLWNALCIFDSEYVLKVRYKITMSGNVCLTANRRYFFTRDHVRLFIQSCENCTPHSLLLSSRCVGAKAAPTPTSWLYQQIPRTRRWSNQKPQRLRHGTIRPLLGGKNGIPKYSAWIQMALMRIDLATIVKTWQHIWINLQ